MTVTVPTLLVVLPLIAVVLIAWCVLFLWVWNRWIEPPIMLMMLRRVYGNDEQVRAGIHMSSEFVSERQRVRILKRLDRGH